MKRILILIAASAVLSSCFKGSSYEYSGTINETYEYSNLSDLFPDGTTVFFEFKEGVFQSGDLWYYNKSSADYHYGGFAVSQEVTPKQEEGDETPEEVTPSPYRVCSDTGASGKTFMVFYDSGMMPEHDLQFMAFQYGTFSPMSVMVNNTALVIDAITGKNDPTRKFEKGDRLKLIAKGYLNGQETGKAEFLLAAPGEGKEGADSLVTGWKNFDLGALGNVEFIDFEIESTQNWLEKYVCIDNLSAKVYVKIE